MADWFWIVFLYSFGGFLLERFYARLTRAANQSRRCLLLLPLCPVYGLGVAAVLALPPAWRSWPAVLVTGAAAATAVEYGYHWVCQRFLGVRFWDYTGLPGSLHGRVCLPFSLAWGVLIAAALAVVQPGVERLLPHIPPAVTLLAAGVLAVDAFCSARLLALSHDPRVLERCPPGREGA